MGLDMYLYAEKQIDQYDYEMHNGEMTRRDNLNFDIANRLVKEMPTGEYGGITITKCVGYWRKANAVHGWIVRNLADGVDECQRIGISREDLIKLREACLLELNNRGNAKPNEDDTITLNGDNPDEVAQIVMDNFKKQMTHGGTVSLVTETNPIPPMAGFFFGGTEKDEWYYGELANTAELVNVLIASDPNEEYSYYYQASW